MAEFVLAVMLVALVLYAVFGGADFGVGIIEPFIRERDGIDGAIAPVWEANHVWLVLALVLAFVGFPEFYALTTTYLHLPLLGVLFGIVARGTAFTFRHYDPAPGKLAGWYNVAFRAGSVLTPLFLGICMAATASGHFPTDPEAGFYAWYIAPWNTPFAWATGLFVCALFAFEGAALLSAEQALAGLPLPNVGLTRFTHVLAIASGALVFSIAYFENLPWLRELLSSGWALGALTGGTLLIPTVASAFDRGRPWLLRIAMGAQVSCVLFGFFAAQFPVLLRLDTRLLTYQDAMAPAATLRTLIWALIVGLLLILPGFVYLIRAYKANPHARMHGSHAH
jgi:cytochrome d ubiquinol oxidase subunit II